jgi:gliding motility-associated-like protein
MICQFAQSQQETTYWFLNSGNQLQFSGTATLPGTTGIQSGVGSTSLKDNAGNLLFVSNGAKVFNKNQAVMPALTNASLDANTNVLLSTPIPGSTSQHYLFYAKQPGFDAAVAIKYAIVDMALNGGLGDVTTYNNLVDSGFGKAFTLVAKPGSADFWIVAHKQQTDSFYARLVTAAGISSTPVITRAGQGLDKTQNKYLDLRPSHNGKMLAAFSYVNYPGIFAYTIRFVEVFNFNQATGAVTNKVKTPTYPGYFIADAYVEFSPDNKLLYSNEYTAVPNLQPCGFASSSLRQYNLCYTDSTEFVEKSAQIGMSFSFCYFEYMGRMQMGPDKKIYLPFSPTNKMRRIEYPNRIGSSSTFNTNAISFTGPLSATTPSFFHAHVEKSVKNNIVYQPACYPIPFIFSVSNDTIASIVWNFGDPASGSSNASNQLQPQHIFSAPGIYTVSASLYNSVGQLIEIITELVEVKIPFQRLLYQYPMSTTFCEGDTLKIKLNVVDGIFIWTFKAPDGTVYDYSVTDSVAITQSGTWYVEMRQGDCNGCVMRDSINVNVLPRPYVQLGNDRNLCTGDSIVLSVLTPGASCLWSTGATTPSITITQGGTYWVRADINGNGCYIRDTVVITQTPGIQLNFPNDTVLCANQILLLNLANSNATSFFWQDGSSNNSFLITQPGQYWVRAYNGQCFKTDTINVSYVSATAVNLGADTVLCQGNALTLNSNVSGAVYLWSTGATTSSISINTGGSYWLAVSNANCSLRDTITVNFQALPTVSLGNDTVLCMPERKVLRATTPGATYLWSDGSVADTLVVSTSGLYWVKVKVNACTVSDSINLLFKPHPIVNIGNDTSICSNQILPLNAASPGSQAYLWNTGATTPAITASSPGIYWVQVTGTNGCIKRDSILVGSKPLPGFSLGNDTTLCQGQQVTLSTGLANATYSWSNSSAAPTFTTATSGVYWVDVTLNQCTQRDSINVAFTPLPMVNLGNDTTLCEDQIMLLNPQNSSSSFIWHDGSTAPTFTATKAGLYTVSVTSNNCTAKDSIIISYTLKPSFTLGADRLICPGQTIILQPVLNPLWQLLWQDGSTDKTLHIVQPGLYYLEATNECGFKRDEILFTKGLCNIYIPNAFTPNNDGKNDVFKVWGTELVASFKLQIFNRYGQLLFETTDKNKGWDGRFGGQFVNIGNYTYICTYKEQGQQQATVIKGNVLVLQ